jgi:TRAP-type C4-dicarboxylate transport system permease small subunit
MRQFCRGIELMVECAAVLLVVAFTLLILADVICRYWLHIGIPWVSELSVFLFQWTVFLGAILALRRGLHFGLGLVLRRAFPAAVVPLGVLVALATAATSSLLLVLSIRMAVQTWGATYSTLEISHGWAYVGVAISTAAMALFALEQGVMLIWPARTAEAA